MSFYMNNNFCPWQYIYDVQLGFLRNIVAFCYDFHEIFLLNASSFTKVQDGSHANMPNMQCMIWNDGAVRGKAAV